jgi:hypothetical protein
MVSMQPELASLFQENNMHADLIAKFETALCTSVGIFAHWFEDNAEVKDWCNSIVATKDDPRARATVKFCMEKAKTLSNLAIAKAAAGIQEHPIDEPLPSDQHRNMMSVATALYRWISVDPRTICCDSQMGKFKREFTVWQPSMINFAKLKTLAQSRTTVPPKRQKLGEGVSLQMGSPSRTTTRSLTSSHGQNNSP